MTRRTSIDAYHAIKEDGLLSKLRMLVYETIYHHGPVTQMETCRIINEPGIQDRSIMPRFAELVLLEVLSEVGTKVCQYTNREVMLYDVTENLPKDANLLKRNSRKDKRATEIMTKIKNTVSLAMLGPDLMRDVEEYLR